VKFVAIGLSKELAGNYNSAYGFLQLFGILADFGLYAVALREISRDELQREKVLGALIVIRAIILLLSLFLALTLVWLLPQWRGTPLPLSVTIASLVPLFTLMAGIIRTVFQVQYKMQYIFMAEVAQRILTVSFIGLFILMGVRGSHDLHILHLFLFIGGVGAFLLFFLSYTIGNRLMNIRVNFDEEMIKKLLRAAIPYGAAFFCMALYRQFDVTMIALLRSDFELQNAYYGFVVRMADMGYLIPTFLLNSTLPILSDRDVKGKDTSSLLGKTMLILLLLGTISSLFAALWSRPLILLMTTESYLSTPLRAGSDTALYLMSIPLFLNVFVLYGFYILLTKHRWKQLVSMLMIGAVVSLTFSTVLIPLHGFVGAVTTSIIVHVLLSILLLPQALKLMPIHLPLKHIFQWLIFSLLLGLGLMLIRPHLLTEWHTVLGLVGMSVGMVVLGWLVGLKRTLG
jgi:O-antigen/teichoic acid export membrane protein